MTQRLCQSFYAAGAQNVCTELVQTHVLTSPSALYVRWQLCFRIYYLDCIVVPMRIWRWDALPSNPEEQQLPLSAACETKTEKSVISVVCFFFFFFFHFSFGWNSLQDSWADGRAWSMTRGRRGKPRLRRRRLLRPVSRSCLRRKMEKLFSTSSSF